MEAEASGGAEASDGPAGRRGAAGYEAWLNMLVELMQVRFCALSWSCASVPPVLTEPCPCPARPPLAVSLSTR